MIKKSRLYLFFCTMLVATTAFVSVGSAENLSERWLQDLEQIFTLEPEYTIELPAPALSCDPENPYAGLHNRLDQQLIHEASFRVLEQVSASFASRGMVLSQASIEQLEEAAVQFVRCTFPGLVVEEIYAASDEYDPAENPVPTDVLAYLVEEHLKGEGLVNYYVEAMLDRSALPVFCGEENAELLTGYEPGSQGHLNAVMQRLDQGRLPPGITRPGSFLSELMGQADEDSDACAVGGSDKLDDYLDFGEDPLLAENLQGAYMSGWDDWNPAEDLRFVQGMRPLTQEEQRRNGWFYTGLGVVANVIDKSPVSSEFFSNLGQEMLDHAKDQPSEYRMGILLFEYGLDKLTLLEECEEEGGTCEEERDAFEKAAQNMAFFCAAYPTHKNCQEEEEEEEEEAVEAETEEDEGIQCPPEFDICGSTDPVSLEEYCSFTSNPDLCIASLLGGKTYGESLGIITPWRDENGTLDEDDMACLLFGICPDMHGDPMIPLIYPEPGMFDGMEMCEMQDNPLDLLIRWFEDPFWDIDDPFWEMDDSFWDQDLMEDILGDGWDPDIFDQWGSEMFDSRMDAYDGWSQTSVCEDLDACQRAGLSAALANAMLKGLVEDLFHDECFTAAQPGAPREPTIDPVTPTPELEVYINGRKLRSDVPPIIIQGRTMVPLRGIFEALDTDVEYLAETRTITATRGTTKIQLTVDSNQAQINGQKVTLDVPPTIVNGRTLVPVRFISESTGQKVSWDEENQRVLITAQFYTTPDQEKVVLEEKEPEPKPEPEENPEHKPEQDPEQEIDREIDLEPEPQLELDVEDKPELELEPELQLEQPDRKPELIHTHFTLTVSSLEGENELPGISISSKTGHGGTTHYSLQKINKETQVHLEAPQYVGSGLLRKRFSYWSGAVSSKDRSVTFTMEDDETVTAHYVAAPERFQFDFDCPGCIQPIR